MFLLGCALARAVAAEEPMATRLTPDLRVYPQFFSVAQDERRQLYIGGTDGILRHDGARWAWIALPKPGAVRALSADPDGRLWFGGTDSFGWLETLPTGEQRVVDVSSQFAADLHGEPYSDVWTIARFKGVTWFAALHELFAVDAKGHRVGHWHRDERFGEISVVGDALWVQFRGEGLRRWDGHGFVPIPGTASLGGSPVYAMIALADGGVLVHDVANGLSIWRDGATTRIDDAPLQGDIGHLKRAVALPDGRLAFAGDDGRLRVFDLARRRFETFTIGGGYTSDVVLDRDGALLAVDDQGVVRVPWPARWTRYGSAEGVVGDVHAIDAIDGRVFVCGSAGVQETAIVDDRLAPLREKSWPANECWTVQRIGDATLVAESSYLLRIDGDRAVPQSSSDFYPRALLADPGDPSRLWVGTEDGPALMVRDGSDFKLLARLKETGWRASSLAPANGGVWFGSDDHGLFLAHADTKAPHGIAVEDWTTGKGIEVGPGQEAGVSALPEGVFVSTAKGLFRFDRGRFVKDDGGLQPLLDPGELVRLRAGDGGDRWAFSYHSVYRKPAQGAWRIELAGNPASGVFDALLPLPHGDALVGSIGYLARFRDGGSGAGASHATVRVTGVRLNRDGKTSQALPLDSPPQVQPKGGSLDFDLAFTDFGAEGDKQYQVRLEGFSKGWSAWSTQSSYRYFALPPGDYVLHLRARREYETPVEGAPFRFTIVPRWYERRWVPPLLVLLLSAIVAAALIQRQRRRVRQLRERNVELDRLVHARTQDLERVNLRLKDLVDRDGLTDIANRRRFDDYLALSTRLAREQNKPLGLAMVDVDHFKQYNDAHGHQAGDDILRKVARVLGDGVRGDTLVARYGGEEFALVAPGCDLAQIREVAERLRSQVAANLGGVTVSIGVCGFDPARPDAIEALVARADAALYRAKNAGRNCVV